MKEIGLVFAGGGGKGAYEMGVWKYFHEIGLEPYVKVASGTSVGALNAALFVGSSYEVAEKLWLGINQKKILTPKEIPYEEIMKWIFSVGTVGVPNSFTGKNGNIASNTIISTEKMMLKNVYRNIYKNHMFPSSRIIEMIVMMLKKIQGDYVFSRSGIVEMISEGINFNMLQTSKIPCYVTCVCCDDLEIERFKLNDYSKEDIITLLLASSAIPIVFPNEKFHGRDYCDGGIPIVGDNIPIKPVYDTGVETIVVVHLSQDTVIDKEQFPNAKIIEIIPQQDLGNIFKGTLDFSPQGVRNRLQLGYEDARRIMKPMVEKRQLKN